MPRQERIFTVFVASPADVKDERDGLEEVIRELNISWSRELGIRLDLVRWETHAYPGLGDDAQAVINEQIPQDYDLFVGIMWCRFGTATGRAESGTEEEFKLAKKRHEQDPSSVDVMFYFKDAPISPSKLDPGQLLKVDEFKRSLGEEGGLHWTFNDAEEFVKLIRLHLTKKIQCWHRQPVTSAALLPSEPALVKVTAEGEGAQVAAQVEDELGLMDLIEIYEERFGEFAKIGMRIAKYTEELVERLSLRTTEINEAASKSGGAVGMKEAKKLIARAATDMDQYAERMEAELPLFKLHLGAGMDAFIRASSMMGEFDRGETGRADLSEALEAMVQVREMLSTMAGKIQSSQATVMTLPRMTKELNRSKRRVASVLLRLVEQMRSGQTLINEGEKVLRSLITS
jgi:hypothetical protein